MIDSKGPRLQRIAETRGTWTGTSNAPSTPMFFVRVAPKGFKHCASPLFATHTRRSRSVASKGLMLHKNCALHIVASRRWAQTEGRNCLQWYPEATVPEEYGLVKRKKR